MSTGKALETLVRKSADAQRPQGLNLAHTSPRFVGRVGPNGEAQGRVVSKGTLDFLGDYRGRLVTFDAKSTKTKSFPLRLIKRHQATIVRNAHQRGAIAFFLVEFTDTGAYYAMPWPVLAPWWGEFDMMGDPASIPRQVIESECLAIAKERGRLDLVGVIERLTKEGAA